MRHMTELKDTILVWLYLFCSSTWTISWHSTDQDIQLLMIWKKSEIISGKILWCLNSNKFWRNQGADAEVLHLFIDCIQPTNKLSRATKWNSVSTNSHKDQVQNGGSLSSEAVAQKKKRSGYWLIIIWILFLGQHGNIVLDLVNKGMWRR